jgi:hypothetical protein
VFSVKGVLELMAEMRLLEESKGGEKGEEEEGEKGREFRGREGCFLGDLVKHLNIIT